MGTSHVAEKYPTYSLSETEAKTLLHVLEEKNTITDFSLDIFASVKHLWMFSLTSQTSGREPASRHTSSLNATVLNSPLCLLYPSWHPFSSLEPKTALHYKIQQKCKRNERTRKKVNNLSKLETSFIISQYLFRWGVFNPFWLALTSDWLLSAAESGWNRQYPCLSLTQTNTTPTSSSDCPEIHLKQIQIKQAYYSLSGATKYQVSTRDASV